MVLIAELASLDAVALRRAIETTFTIRRTHPVPTTLPAPPPEWSTPFAELARTVGIPTDLASAHYRRRNPRPHPRRETPERNLEYREKTVDLSDYMQLLSNPAVDDSHRRKPGLSFLRRAGVDGEEFSEELPERGVTHSFLILLPPMPLPGTTGRGVCRARTCCPQSTATAHPRNGLTRQMEPCAAPEIPSPHAFPLADGIFTVPPERW